MYNSTQFSIFPTLFGSPGAHFWKFQREPSVQMNLFDCNGRSRKTVTSRLCGHTGHQPDINIPVHSNITRHTEGLSLSHVSRRSSTLYRRIPPNQTDHWQMLDFFTMLTRLVFARGLCTEARRPPGAFCLQAIWCTEEWLSWIQYSSNRYFISDCDTVRIMELLGSLTEP